MPFSSQALFRNRRGIMKRKQTKITDISFDVLRHIMLYISKSSGGAKNLTRTLAACRDFKELAEDPVILKAATFDDVKLSEVHESFWQLNGLLFRCIRAGNLSAMFTAFEYAETYIAAVENRFRRALMKLRMSIVEAQIVNTRARQRALILAFNDFQNVIDSSDECYQKALLFSEALEEAMGSID